MRKRMTRRPKLKLLRKDYEDIDPPSGLRVPVTWLFVWLWKLIKGNRKWRF